MANDLNIVYKIAADISGLQKGVERAASATEKLQSLAVNVGAAFGVAFSAQAVIGFGKALLDTAGQLSDLSVATGVSTTDLQKLGYIGVGVGVDMAELGRAVGTLSERLAGGDASATAAVAKLGLNLDQLLKAGPKEAFVQIGDAVGTIADPMEKNAVAADLFGGKLARHLIPLLGNLREEMEKVPKDALISDAQIAQADKMGDAWDRLLIKVKAYSFAALGTLGLGHEAQVGDIEATIHALEKLGVHEGKIFDDWNAHLAKQAAETQTQKEAMEKAIALGPGFVQGFQQGADALDKIHEAFRERAAEAAEAASALNTKIREMFSGGDVLAAAKTYEAAVAAIGGASKLTAAEQKTVAEAFQKVIDKYKALGPAGAAVVAHFEALRREMYTIPPILADLAASSEETKMALFSIGEHVAVRDAQLDLYSLGLSVEELQRKGMDLQAFWKDMGTTLGVPLPNVQSSLTGVDTSAIKEASFDLNELANNLTQLAQVSGDSWGAAEQGIGRVIVSASGLQSAMKALDAEIEKNGTAAWQSYASAGTAAFSVLMTGYGLLYDYINKKNAENQRTFDALHDAVVDFDERAAQFQFTIPSEDWVELNKKLQALFQMDPKDRNGIAALSAEIEGLISKYEKLAGMASSRYGMNANELKQAAQDAHDTFDYMLASGLYTQTQLDAAYLDFQKALAATGDAAAKAWLEARGEIDATGKSANAALDALTKRRDDIAATYANEAPEEVMGSIEAAARAQVAALDQQIAAEKDRIAKAAEAAAAVIDDKVGGAGDKVGERLKNGIVDGLSEGTPAAEGAKSDIETVFKDFEIKIPFEFYQVGPGPTGSSASPASPGPTPRGAGSGFVWWPDMDEPTRPDGGPIYFAGGGIAHSYGLEPWSLDGLRGPRGIDTIPAWLSEGETVRTPRQEAALHAGGSDERTIVVENHNTLMLDGQIVAENFITRAQHDKRGAGTKLKKVLGIPQ